ncbi:VanZ family protein [Arenimonas sp.]|uniref:VanZ family protein n=1 Tax=Arenimonas sp. TaxID=1872635 RepID=UPI0039E3C7F4
MLSGLRYGYFWWLFGWCAVAAALVLSLLPSSAPVLPHWNDKLQHALGYFLLTFWFCGIYPRQRYWLVALAMFGMGVLVEVLQGVMHLGRQAEWRDLLADAVGIVPAVLLALTPLGQWPRWIEALIRRA